MVEVTDLTQYQRLGAAVGLTLNTSGELCYPVRLMFARNLLAEAAALVDDDTFEEGAQRTLNKVRHGDHDDLARWGASVAIATMQIVTIQGR